MTKTLSFIIESIFWLQLFFAPVIIGALAALFIYISSEKLLWLSIMILVVSGIIGLLFAERIRKKYGASRYLSKILGGSEEIKTKEKK